MLNELKTKIRSTKTLERFLEAGLEPELPEERGVWIISDKFFTFPHPNLFMNTWIMWAQMEPPMRSCAYKPLIISLPGKVTFGSCQLFSAGYPSLHHFKLPSTVPALQLYTVALATGISRSKVTISEDRRTL